MTKIIDFNNPKYNKKKVEKIDIASSCITGKEIFLLLEGVNSLYKTIRPLLDPIKIRNNVNYSTDLDDDAMIYSSLCIDRIIEFLILKIKSEKTYEELDSECIKSFIEFNLNIAEELASDLNEGILLQITE